MRSVCWGGRERGGEVLAEVTYRRHLWLSTSQSLGSLLISAAAVVGGSV